MTWHLHSKCYTLIISSQTSVSVQTSKVLWLPTWEGSRKRKTERLIIKQILMTSCIVVKHDSGAQKKRKKSVTTHRRGNNEHITWEGAGGAYQQHDPQNWDILTQRLNQSKDFSTHCNQKKKKTAEVLLSRWFSFANNAWEKKTNHDALKCDQPL